MSATMTPNAEGFYPMRTTSRSLGKSVKAKSQTRGKEKGGNCARSELKTWGMNANPYKLAGGDLDRYNKYCALTTGLNK